MVLSSELIDLPGPYTSLTKNVDITNKFPTDKNFGISVTIKTGNDPKGGILMFGNSGGCGNLYLWVGSNGTLNFGVQCNGNGSDAPLNPPVKVQPSSIYNIKAILFLIIIV